MKSLTEIQAVNLKAIQQAQETKSMDEKQAHLIAFCDGSYKKVTPTAWKHSQWIHYTLEDGSVVMVNPNNINYIHRGIDDAKYLDPDKHKEGI